jgi:hypothetical protein
MSSEPKSPSCDNKCRFTEDEREWLHTACKYVDSKHLPTLGKILKAFEDTSYMIGKAVLMAIIVGGGSLLLWWTIIKIK